VPEGLKNNPSGAFFLRIFHRDNVFVERLWRIVKYEHVYLHAYESISEAKTKIGQYFEFYNQRRPHSKLDRLTPDQVYFKSLSSKEAA